MLLSRSPGEMVLATTMFLFTGSIIYKYFTLPAQEINPHDHVENFLNFNTHKHHNKTHRWIPLESRYEKIN